MFWDTLSHTALLLLSETRRLYFWQTHLSECVCDCGAMSLLWQRGQSSPKRLSLPVSSNRKGQIISEQFQCNFSGYNRRIRTLSVGYFHWPLADTVRDVKVRYAAWKKLTPTPLQRLVEMWQFEASGSRPIFNVSHQHLLSFLPPNISLINQILTTWFESASFLRIGVIRRFTIWDIRHKTLLKSLEKLSCSEVTNSISIVSPWKMNQGQSVRP